MVKDVRALLFGGFVLVLESNPIDQFGELFEGK